MGAGLVAAMEGMVVGEQREVGIVFPDKWVPQALAGVGATCDVKVKELFLCDLPPVSAPPHPPRRPPSRLALCTPIRFCGQRRTLWGDSRYDLMAHAVAPAQICGTQKVL